MEEQDPQSYTTADEENDADYTSLPVEAVDNNDLIETIDTDVYDGTPVGDIDTEELDDQEFDEEEDPAQL